MSKNIRDFRELRVNNSAMYAAMEFFRVTSQFPPEEKYSLVHQIRRSSRSVWANIAEAWRKRRYRGAFVAKLADAEREAAETQVWLDFSERCGCLASERVLEPKAVCDRVVSSLVKMIRNTDKWIIRNKE